MARGNQQGRQWQIIQLLVSARRGWSTADLARELEVNPRTVYRDLEALQVAGFPLMTRDVEEENRDVRGTKASQTTLTSGQRASIIA